MGLGFSSSSSVETNLSSKIVSSDETSQRPDVDQLCQLLHDRIVANGSKAFIADKWRREARLLLDRDERPLDEALWLVNWCQNDSFWSTNILSMAAFRKHYDRLRMQSHRKNNPALSATSASPSNVTELATSDQRFQRGRQIAEARRARRLAAEQQPPALPGAAS
jgi:hypothetical protein